MNGRERTLAVLAGREADSLPLMPITMMFSSARLGIPYGKYVTDCRLLVDAQIGVARDFDCDYVSGISDPCREAADCGARIQFFENQPPAVLEAEALLEEKSRLATLKVPDPLGGGRMHDRVRAMALFKERVGREKFIEGWIEGPCAEAADLRGINTLMTDFIDDPAFVRDVFEFVLEMEIRFAEAQMQAGADIIGMGDAAASLVGPGIYDEIVWPYEKRLVDALHAMGTRVRLHICGNTSRILDGMGRLGCDIVDLDWPAPVQKARAEMGPDQVLAGNFDPVRVLRNGTPESIAEAIRECHAQAGPRYIVAPGCEVPRDTPEANLKALTYYARSHRPG